MNQRDFVFVRQHRYMFTGEGKVCARAARCCAMGGCNFTIVCQRAALQELGPRFTLKLRWILNGTFDTKHGEYEWLHKRKEMDTSRRRFHL